MNKEEVSSTGIVISHDGSCHPTVVSSIVPHGATLAVARTKSLFTWVASQLWWLAGDLFWRELPWTLTFTCFEVGSGHKWRLLTWSLYVAGAVIAGQIIYAWMAAFRSDVRIFADGEGLYRVIDGRSRFVPWKSITGMEIGRHWQDLLLHTASGDLPLPLTGYSIQSQTLLRRKIIESAHLRRHRLVWYSYVLENR